MNRAQKIAWFNLIVIPLGSAMVLLTVFIELPDLVSAIGLVVVLVLVFTSPVFFRRKPGRISFDERDAIIYQRAMLIGLSAAFGCIGGQILVKLMGIGLEGSARLYEVIGIYISGLICFIVAKSLTILIQYGRKLKGEKS
jgi:hypothetical protein